MSNPTPIFVEVELQPHAMDTWRLELEKLIAAAPGTEFDIAWHLADVTRQLHSAARTTVPDSLGFIPQARTIGVHPVPLSIHRKSTQLSGSPLSQAAIQASESIAAAPGDRSREHLQPPQGEELLAPVHSPALPASQFDRS